MNENKIKQIRLTPKESDLWNWAQAAAVDYWDDDYGRDDGLHFDACPVGRAENGMASILAHADVIGDMMYRLGIQLQEMARAEGAIWADGTPDDNHKRAAGTARAARRIVKKLESNVCRN